MVPKGLLDDTVVGLTPLGTSVPQSVVGLAVTDGTARWSIPETENTTIAAAGPHFVVVLSGPAAGGKRSYALVRANGAVTDRTTGAYGSQVRCRYDGASVTVCTLGDSTPLFGLHARTGELLWQLPTAGRVAPKVTAAWHGAVYGTASGKPVVLDAHTGADRQTNPALAPTAVSGYAGVGTVDQPEGGSALLAYPAIG